MRQKGGATGKKVRHGLFSHELNEYPPAAARGAPHSPDDPNLKHWTLEEGLKRDPQSIYARRDNEIENSRAAQMTTDTVQQIRMTSPRHKGEPHVVSPTPTTAPLRASPRRKKPGPFDPKPEPAVHKHLVHHSERLHTMYSIGENVLVRQSGGSQKWQHCTIVEKNLNKKNPKYNIVGKQPLPYGALRVRSIRKEGNYERIGDLGGGDATKVFFGGMHATKWILPHDIVKLLKPYTEEEDPYLGAKGCPSNLRAVSSPGKSAREHLGLPAKRVRSRSGSPGPGEDGSDEENKSPSPGRARRAGTIGTDTLKRVDHVGALGDRAFCDWLLADAGADEVFAAVIIQRWFRAVRFVNVIKILRIKRGERGIRLWVARVR